MFSRASLFKKEGTCNCHVEIFLRNWPDDDIRLYAWTIISTTLSIFTAVLSFSGVRASRLHEICSSFFGAELYQMVLVGQYMSHELFTEFLHCM